MLEILKKKSHLFYLILISLFTVLFVTVELNNGKLYANDFKVYYEATIDFFKGNNPYLHAYGLSTGFFKYPPTTLLLFAPATIFSFDLVKISHIILLFLLLATSLPLWQRLISNVFYLKPTNWILSLCFFVIVIHLTREYHMGNVNLILLGTFIFGSWFYYKEKWFFSSIFYALMLILKPIMILVVIPIILYRNWKVLFLLTCWGMIFLFGPILIWGWKTNWILWSGWVKSVSSHGEYITGPSSFQFMIPKILGLPNSWLPSLFALGILLGVWFKMKRTKKEYKEVDFWCWISIFLGLTPNFFVTDCQHFLLSIPMIMLVLLFAVHLKNKWIWIMFFVGMLLFSFDSMDLWGRELSSKFTEWGILGIGNLIFIVSMLLVWSKQRRIDATSHNL